MQRYPRTPHLVGSGIQRGDDDLAVAPFQDLAGRHLIVEEKLDGANAAISFSGTGQLRLQSRGHILRGGAREAQFDLFKSWASRYAAELHAVLGARYVLFGEWLYAKHTIFYSELPHYFLEFDLYDRQLDGYLDSERRRALLQRLPFLHSVPVLHQGQLPSLAALLDLLGPSRFVGADHLALLRERCLEQQLDPERVLRETDLSRLAEGLYLKVEEQGLVQARYKYVRPGFQQAVLDSQSHWFDRPLLPNRLRPGADLFR